MIVAYQVYQPCFYCAGLAFKFHDSKLCEKNIVQLDAAATRGQQIQLAPRSFVRTSRKAGK